MNPKIKILIGIVALGVVIGGSALLYPYLSASYASKGDSTSAGSTSGGEEEKMEAPDFSVVDGDGNTVKLSDFIGKPVVVNFWASWCPPCKSEMPEFERVRKELGEDVVFMMVNATDGVRETEEKAKEYVADQGYTFPVYFDTNQEASYTYGVSSLPTTLFIDKDGYLVTGALGVIEEETLRKGIEMIQPEE